jgi:hypothetical protein
MRGTPSLISSLITAGKTLSGPSHTSIGKSDGYANVVLLRWQSIGLIELETDAAENIEMGIQSSAICNSFEQSIFRLEIWYLKHLLSAVGTLLIALHL